MGPDDLAALSSLAGPLLGGAVGTIASAGDKRKSKNELEDALSGIQGVQGPNYNFQAPGAPQLISNLATPDYQRLDPVTLQQYSSAGTYSPEMEQLAQQDPSAFSSISTDPALKQAQMAALASLQQVAQQGGHTTTDDANLNRILMSQRQNTAGQVASIQDQMQRRGLGSSGADLLAQLTGAQNASNQEQQSGLDIAGQEQQRALAALASGGSLAGNMQSQSFNQQAQQAAAQDAINRFNTTNRQGVLGQNAQLANQAQQYNLGNQQSLLNSNADIRNKQTQLNQIDATKYNNQMQGQQFANQAQAAGFANQAAQQGYNNANNAYQYGNQLQSQGANFNMGKAQATAGQQNNLSNYYGNQQKQTMDMYGKLGQAAGQTGAAYATKPEEEEEAVG